MYNPVKTVGSKHSMLPTTGAILGCTVNFIEKVHHEHEILDAVNQSIVLRLCDHSGRFISR